VLDVSGAVVLASSHDTSVTTVGPEITFDRLERNAISLARPGQGAAAVAQREEGRLR
jgi:hypothetical protein